MMNEKEFSDNIHFMIENWWNGSMSKQFRLYLSRNQLDENQLKFLLEHTFVEGVNVGTLMAKSVINETVKGSHPHDNVEVKK